MGRASSAERHVHPGERKLNAMNALGVSANRGFTLIELMITLVILGILITVGVPSLADFVATQRVRTTASDLMADMAFARAEAIKESRRVIMQRVAGATSTWKDGWNICVDLNGDNTCSAGEIRKSATPLSGRTKMCATTAELGNNIVFRPDGRIVRNTAVAANDGILISDDFDDGNAANNRARLVFLGVSGRPSMQIQDGGASC
jgi:type IV fimbrial biogenesis protein FimT